MKIKRIIVIICLLFNVIVEGQSDSLRHKTIDPKDVVEDFILAKEMDSAALYISRLKTNSSYLDVLRKIVQNETLDYKKHQEFITTTSKRTNVGYKDVSEYINANVQLPKSSTEINTAYVEIKIGQITKLRDDGDLDNSSRLNRELEKYFNQFDANSEIVKRTKARASTHKIVMYLIQGNLDQGKEIIQKNLEIARAFDDKELSVISFYLLSDFLVKEGKLQEYIDVCEKSLVIESELPEHTDYHYAILLHLIDAYIFKKGNDKRVLTLLNEVHDNYLTRYFSYSLYIKYLTSLPPDSDSRTELFKQFNVRDTKEFIEFVIEKTENSVNSNSFLDVLEVSSRALERDGFLKEALFYQRKSEQLTRKIYSEKLSSSLADFQTQEAIKVKDLEIKNQKSKTNFYIVSAIIGGILLLITFYFLVKSIKQSKKLKIKNQIIDKSLKEKELLVKEVHHRVKNNFQMVSSLLELQSKGIEDEKALKLASDGKHRVRSMALIHQKLYQNEDGLINFEEYINSLVKELSSLYASDMTIDTKIDSAKMHFDVDTAIPLGLIINEVITNSYKHAFKKGRENELRISIHRIYHSDDYRLIISDNGSGIDSNIDIKKVKSLGLRLVTRLVKQLQGTLQQSNDDGTKFEITFKDSKGRKELL
ncbi:sensory transduction histidine kinase [Nonlabens ulvanivorans]|nr:sensor histidine kinase [Nonlabens ulvanivorans]GAK90002.1 sensory transduction histidine kinase [Nonlabens ulvanivorans]